MPPYAGPPTAARTGDVADTLRLLAYLALAVVLIVLDHRGGWLKQARQHAAVVAAPIWAVAGWPGRLFERISDDAGTLAQLTAENRQLRQDALINQARMARLQALAADNQRLRGLLEAAERGNLDVVLAPILDIDLDPTRQRLVLDAGSRDRVRVGQSVIDAGGLLGQIIGITPMHANVLLITDPSHAVPVAVARNGVRLVVYGEGNSARLKLQSVPMSSDVKVGDLLVTSGLGGRFPPGFPVGRIAALKPDDSRAFLVGEVEPAAQIDRGREVLVLLSMPPQTPPDPAGFASQPAMPDIAATGTGAATPEGAAKPADSAAATGQGATPPRGRSGGNEAAGGGQARSPSTGAAAPRSAQTGTAQANTAQPSASPAGARATRSPQTSAPSNAPSSSPSSRAPAAPAAGTQAPAPSATRSGGAQAQPVVPPPEEDAL